MKKNIILTLIIPILLVTSCSTEFDINADWKDIAVVYGLLDQSDTIQYIKLNKVFLGNENAYVMAMESDSIFYDSAEVYLEPLVGEENIYDNSGNKIRIQLEENYDIEKDSGIFTTDNNLIYSTTESLNINNNYRLVVDVPGKESISAITSLIDDFTVIKPSTFPGQRVNFYNGQTHTYQDYSVTFRPNEVGELYGVTLRFHYREISLEGQEDFYVDWVQSTKRRPSVVNANTEMNISVNGASFFTFVANHIHQNDPAIKRIALDFDFIFMVAGKELALYLEINGPSDGIIQERPAFTNIENGIGVFSSRYTKMIDNKRLHGLTLDELSCGEVTKHLRFADQYGAWDCIN